MVVRIPDPDESIPFASPIRAAEAMEPFAGLPKGMKETIDRMQARDDAVFVAGALADLTARHRTSAIAAEDAVHQAGDDPAMWDRQVDGFAKRLDDEFASDVDRIIQERKSLSAPRPSDGTLDLFRRRADGVRRGGAARNALTEDRLRRVSQMRTLETGIERLEATVASEPEGLDEAVERLGDLTGAAGALIGREEAAALDSETRQRLATAAVRGLVGRDADAGLDALRSGGFDAHLDGVTRSRLSRDAELLSRATVRDRELRQRKQVAEATHQQESRALSFIGNFHRRRAMGDAEFGEIVAAVADGTVSPARGDALRMVLEQDLADRAVEDAKVARVSSIVEDGRMPDPDDPEHRDAVEAFFAQVIKPQTENLSPKDLIDLLESLPDILGVMPESAICPLGGMVLAGEPDTRIAAAKAVIAVLGNDPSARACLPPAIEPLAGVLNELGRLQIPAERAVELAERRPHDFFALYGPNDPPPQPVPMPGTGEWAEPVPLSATEFGGDGSTNGDAGAATSDGTAVDGIPARGTQVAFGPAAAALPAIVGGADAAAVGQAILGSLAAMGILSLGGDTPQDPDTEDSSGGGENDGESEDATPGIGLSTPQPADEPEPQKPPTQPQLPDGENDRVPGRSKEGVPLSPRERRKAIRSTEKVIREHEIKLEKYSKDPEAQDNLGRLRGARSPEERERIIKGRQKVLDRTIRKHQGNLEKFRKDGQ